MTSDLRDTAPRDASTNWRQRLLTRLASPRIAIIASAVGFLLALPSLSVGYFLDDRYHAYFLRGNHLPGGARGAWDLYRFADGSPDFKRGLNEGVFPWWTDPDLRLAFFRPIPSLWRAADFHLFGDAAVIPHIETCLVYALLVFCAAKLYGKWVGGGAAGLAAIAYAIASGHGLPVTWISNRYSLLAALFGLGSVLAHSKARSKDGRSILATALSPALLALALASGETSLGVLGYLAGYAWFLDERGKRSALLSLVPHACVVGAWAIAYRALGYGVSGSGFYVDPLSSPVRFLGKLVVRLPELVLSSVFLPPSEAWTFLPKEKAPFVAACAAVVVIAILAFLVRVTLRRDPARRRAIAALGFGSICSAIPVCATIPDDRNFIIAGFGFLGVLGMAIESLWSQNPRESPLAARGFMWVLTVVHFVFAPILFPARSLNMAVSFQRFIERGAKTIPSGERVVNKVFVVVGAADQLTLVYMILERLLDTGPKARTSTTLTVETAGTYTVKCIDDDTVEIRNPVGELHSVFAELYTAKSFHPGQVFERDLDRVEILETTDTGEPSAIRATIRVPREDRIWLVWQGAGLVEIPAPRPGDELTFEGVDLLSAMQK